MLHSSTYLSSMSTPREKKEADILLKFYAVITTDGFDVRKYYDWRKKDIIYSPPPNTVARRRARGPGPDFTSISSITTATASSASLSSSREEVSTSRTNENITNAIYDDSSNTSTDSTRKSKSDAKTPPSPRCWPN